MKPSHTISRFRLWSVKPEAIKPDDENRILLLSMLREIVRYFGNDREEHVELPRTMSFMEALVNCGQQMGIKVRPVGDVANSMTRGLPIIARDKKRDRPVLLMPRAGNWVIMNHPSRTILSKELHQSFDELIEVLPITKPIGDADKIISQLAKRLLMPIIVFAAIMSTTLLFSSAIGDALQLSFFGKRNRWTLVIAAISAIPFFYLGIRQVVMSMRDHLNFSHIALLDNFYRRLLQRPPEDVGHAFLSQFELLKQEMERGLRRLFYGRTVLVFAAIVIAACLLLAYVSAWSLGVLFAFYCVASLLVFGWWQRAYEHAQDSSMQRKLELDQIIEQSQYAITSVYGLQASSVFEKRLRDALARYLATYWHSHGFARWLKLSFLFLPVVIFLSTIWWLSFFNVDQLPLWHSLLVLIASLMLGLSLSGLFANLLYARSLGFSPSAIASFNSLPRASEKAHIKLASIRGEIDVANISFAHENTGLILIKDLNTKIEAGSLCVITGAAGVGKTTLLKLLAGYYRSHSGHILFDGHDLRSLHPESLHKNFGVIFEDSDIFSGSIYDNILCGRNVAQKSLINLLLSHELFDALLDLPMALETYIFGQGSNLSRLQKAAILLARALVHQPRILFVDDICAGLSGEHQASVANFFDSLSITRIVVSSSENMHIKPEQIINLSRYQEIV